MNEVTTAADDCIELSVFSPDVNLVALFGKPARSVFVVDAGSGTRQLVVVCAGSGGSSRSYTTANGWSKDLKVTKILATTTVSVVQVSF